MLLCVVIVCFLLCFCFMVFCLWFLHLFLRLWCIFACTFVLLGFCLRSAELTFVVVVEQWRLGNLLRHLFLQFCLVFLV